MPQERVLKADRIRIEKKYLQISVSGNVHKFPNKYIKPHIKHCLKVKKPGKLEKPKTYKILFKGKRKTFHAYQIGYIYFHNKYPLKPLFKNKKTDRVISHICGDLETGQSRCIIGEHMRWETRIINELRKKCHNYIRAFYYQFKNKQVRIIGTITVEYVNDILDDNDIQYLKGYKKRVECKCPVQHCFINIGECTCKQ